MNTLSIGLSRLSLGLTLIILSAATGATDEALLETLLGNGVITKEQYEALKKGEAVKAITKKPAPAQDPSLLDVLLENGLISQAQYAALQVKGAQEKKTDPEAKISLKEGFKVKSQDGDFQVQPSVYVQFDSAWYDDEKTDFSNGTELRRARIALAGTILKDWDFKLEADFAGTTQDTGTTNEVTLTDAFVRYTGFKPFPDLGPLAITAGNFKMPFGLEAVGSARYLTFLERGLPFAFLTLRALGGMISIGGDNWTVSTGIFGDTVTTQNSDDEGMGAAARLTYAPFFQTNRVLHFGISGGRREPPDSKTVRFRSKPESNIITDPVTTGRLVDTRDIPGGVNYYTLLGGELAVVYGPLSFQSEYIRAEVDRDLGGDLDFDGYYAYASWFLTGESRNYKPDKGVFDLIVPKRPFSLKSGGLGAWEIGVRFSEIDLNDGAINGGEEQDLTVGLNWYPNAFLRLMANYVDVLELDGGLHNGEAIDLFQLRAQLVY
jgi:phosphate-selective porin OprO and OprP